MKSNKSARPAVRLVAGHATTTSTAIAEFFGKRHDDVLKRIRETMEDAPDEFNARNFAAVEYTDGKGEKRPAYQLTRDGFVLLAMGFTGKAALAWKIKYIEAFNKLEERASAHAAKVIRRKVQAEIAAERRNAALTAPEQTLEELALSRLRAEKFVLYFGTGGFMFLHGVSRKAVVSEPEDLADVIADPNGDVKREHLSAIIQAAAKRLA